MIEKLKELMSLSKRQGNYKPIKSKRGGFSFIYWDGCSKVKHSKNFSVICTSCLKDKNSKIGKCMLNGEFKCQKGAFNKGNTGCACGGQRRKANLVKVGIYEGVGDCIENGYGGVIKFLHLDVELMEYTVECSVCSKHPIMMKDKYFKIPYFHSEKSLSYYCFCNTIKGLPINLKNAYLNYLALKKGVTIIERDICHNSVKDYNFKIKCLTCSTEWTSSYAAFCRSKKGCPYCWRSYSKNIGGLYTQDLSREDTLYILRFYDKYEKIHFIKIGRSFDFNRRYLKSGRYSYKILLLYKSEHINIYNLEQKLLKLTLKCFIKLKDLGFNGRFECRKDRCKFTIKTLFETCLHNTSVVRSGKDWSNYLGSNKNQFKPLWNRKYLEDSWEKELITEDTYIKRVSELAISGYKVEEEE